MRFIKESIIRASPERVFAFHEQPNVLQLLLPPWETSRLVTQGRISEPGSQTIIEAKILGPFTARWIAQHTAYDPPRMFEDVQVAGPFRSWRHRHIVAPHPDGATLRDQIDYEPPLWFFGRLLAPRLVEPRLQRMFDFRHRVTLDWCENRDLAEV